MHNYGPGSTFPGIFTHDDTKTIEAMIHEK